MSKWTPCVVESPYASCAGAVVSCLLNHAGDFPRAGKMPPSGLLLLRARSIPIAQTIEPLAGEVVAWLACVRGCGETGGGACSHLNEEDHQGLPCPPPFAAAYYTAGGVRTYVLASGECEACAEYPCARPVRQPRNEPPCARCSGTGARTDVKAIADRYQPDRPWRDEDTPRLARFEVRT
jgi:hypothetical protein